MQWAGPAFRFPQFCVIAAFALQRNPEPQRFEDPRRPGAGGDQDLFGPDDRVAEPHALDPAAGTREAGESGLEDFAAGRSEAPGERLHIIARPVDHAVACLQRGDEAVVRAEGRFEIPDRLGFVFPPADAEVAPDRPAVAVDLEGRPVPVGHQVGLFANARLGRRAPRQGPVLLQAVADNRRERAGDPADVAVAAVAQIPAQPGQQGRQVGPAQEQRPCPAQQHARRLPEQARNGDRHHGPRHKDAGIAE